MSDEINLSTIRLGRAKCLDYLYATPACGVWNFNDFRLDFDVHPFTLFEAYASAEVTGYLIC